MIKIWSQEEEANRLHARFDAAKLEGLGQAEFARKFGVKGGASMISQHIKNRRPINLDAARAYAKGFSCTIEEISPRLAAEISEASKYTGDADPKDGRDIPSDWPFTRVNKDKLLALSREDRASLEGAIIYAASRLGIDIAAPKKNEEIAI